MAIILFLIMPSTPRSEQAKLLGYENFAQMSMETKMAGSVENVMSMITSLLAKGESFCSVFHEDLLSYRLLVHSICW